RLALQRFFHDQLRRQPHQLRPARRRLGPAFHQRLQPLARARRREYPLHGVLLPARPVSQTKPPLIRSIRRGRTPTLFPASLGHHLVWLAVAAIPDECCAIFATVWPRNVLAVDCGLARPVAVGVFASARVSVALWGD